MPPSLPPSLPPLPPPVDEPRVFGSVVVTTTANGVVSDYSPAFRESYRNACATTFNVNSNLVDVAITPGSVVITVTVYATASNSADNLAAVAAATFSDAATASAFITSQTGQAVTVAQVDVVVTEAPARGGGDDDGLSGGAIAGIVIGVVAGVGLILAAGLIYFKRTVGSVARSEGPQHENLLAHTSRGTNRGTEMRPSESTKQGVYAGSKKAPTTFPGQIIPTDGTSARPGSVAFAQNI